MTQSPNGKRTQKCTKTNTLFCVYREGFCPLFIEKRDTLSVSINGEESGMLLYREAAGESVSLFHREEGDSSFRKRTEHHPSLFRGGRLFLCKEERASLSLQRRIRLLPYVLLFFEEERASPFSIYRGGKLLHY